MRVLLGSVIIAVFVSCLLGCERATRFAIEGSNPPIISLSGDGSALFIRVIRLPAPEGEGAKNEGGLWQIKSLQSIPVSEYPEIKYGIVPAGFVQIVPKNGVVPMPLEEGAEYILFAPTVGASFHSLKFTIKNGKPVELPL